VTVSASDPIFNESRDTQRERHTTFGWCPHKKAGSSAPWKKTIVGRIWNARFPELIHRERANRTRSALLKSIFYEDLPKKFERSAKKVHRV
jgi:hypothetical protein